MGFRSNRKVKKMSKRMAGGRRKRMSKRMAGGRRKRMSKQRRMSKILRGGFGNIHCTVTLIPDNVRRH